MKYIVKNTEPTTFTEWKSNNNSTILQFYAQNNARELWDFFGRSGQVKKDIRKALVEEQGFICAYCNREIHNDDLSGSNDIDFIDTRLIIEHVSSKSADIEANALDYNNMVATCEGGKDVYTSELGIGNIPTNRPYCDKKKLGGAIDLHPLMPECESEITFTIEGDIVGKTTRAQATIDCLGLSYFKTLRKEILRGLLFEDFYAETPIQWISEQDAKLLFQKYNQMENGKYAAFCSAICTVLKENFNV